MNVPMQGSCAFTLTLGKCAHGKEACICSGLFSSGLHATLKLGVKKRKGLDKGRLARWARATARKRHRK